MEAGPTASSYPKWPAGTPRGARAPRKEQFLLAAHLAENGSVSVLPTSNAHISLKSAFRDPRFSIEAESCLDLANGAKKNFRIFFGKNRNFLVFLVSCCFLIWKMNAKFSEFLNCCCRFPVSRPPLSLWSLSMWGMCTRSYARLQSKSKRYTGIPTRLCAVSSILNMPKIASSTEKPDWNPYWNF